MSYIVIGYIDSKTRIAAEEKFFVIEQKKKNKETNVTKWNKKYYFSELADLLRFYVRIFLRRKDKNQEAKNDVLKLLDKITTLETLMNEVGKRLETEWSKARTFATERKSV